MHTDAGLIEACNMFFSDWSACQKACDDDIMHVRSDDEIARSCANLDHIIATPATDIASLKAKAQISKCLDHNYQALVASVCNDVMEFNPA